MRQLFAAPPVRSAGDAGPAHQFLKRSPDAELLLSTIALGCTSLRLGISVVTANTEDFRRIDGLGILQYR